MEVYRLVDNDPPTAHDFLSNFITQPNRTFTDICQACGLSVFKEKEDAIHQNELMAASIYFKRKGLPKKKLALGTTDPHSGLVKNTPTKDHKSHMTYWVFQGISIVHHFKVI
ncbi:hypothetical protein [Cohnella sp. GbtcB17]|uniref:hypothetical protein n=1 Tax=Cohnella sp. GbtcB17 TaxID=2824762 RepID=UPI001C30C160|nr:hypothetical protein [Cohnella sp. GbtcB17]